MAHSKAFRRYASGLIPIAAAALIFRACTQIPDYCSAHNPLDPLRQFCHEGLAVDKCGGKTFDPSTQVCDDEIVKNQTAYLSVNIEPANGGTVSLNPPSDDVSNHQNGSKHGYGIKTKVTATAVPDGDYEFAGWAGAETSGDAEVAVMMDGDDRALTAKFRLKEYAATVASEGSGASGGGNYAAGETVTIKAGTPPSGQTFKNWTTTSAGVTFANANSANTTFTMPKNAVTVTAVFEQIPVAKYAVTVSSAGAGYSGGGSYEAGATVAISAGTAPTGQQFKNWTTTSAGVTLANANSSTTTFTMPKNAVAVTAVFEQLPPDVSYVTFTDSRDNQNYNAVKIGSQTWMVENLNYATKAGEGTSWCYGEGGEVWSGRGGSRYVISSSEIESNCNKYGRLYDWSTAMGLESFYNSILWNGSDVNHRGVCPSGWHLPSSAEWSALVTAVGSPSGTKLKSTSGWNDYQGKSGNGTDDFGFSALPGGYRGSDGSFGDAGDLGYWWTATDYSSGYAYSGYTYSRHMFYNNDDVNEDYYTKEYGYSVRCVQD